MQIEEKTSPLREAMRKSNPAYDMPEIEPELRGSGAARTVVLGIVSTLIGFGAGLYIMWGQAKPAEEAMLRMSSQMQANAVSAGCGAKDLAGNFYWQKLQFVNNEPPPINRIVGKTH